jgi:hypothetical protein
VALTAADDPTRAIDELAACRKPWLFGVRHHSPACAAALPPLLEQLSPTALAVELPADLAPWIDWLGHPDAEAPLAVAAVSRRGDDLGFWPFADFSPELAAIRWARRHGVAVHAIDLPAARRAGRSRGGRAPLGIAARLPGDDSWDHLVEATAVGASAEQLRRAALVYGWALRIDEVRGGGVADHDLRREQFMREQLATLCAAKTARVAAVIGAFHAAALVPDPTLWHAPVPAEIRGEAAGEASAEPADGADVVSSLIPYGFELLDSRSGYPAGIRDPMWQQRLWEVLGAAGDVRELVARCLVEITRAIRARGLPAGVADSRAAAEIASSLAVLRRIAAPGRRELVEAVQSALVQGELLGRGRVVARAMDAVMVGARRGVLAQATPRSGLGPHVAALLAELRLPHAQMVDADDMRLDPLRSPLDRRRHVAMCRLRACGVPYALELESSAAGGVEALTTTWRIRMTPATEAMIELAGLRGVTLRAAAAGSLRLGRARLDAEDRATSRAILALAADAADAGVGELVSEWLGELAGPRLTEAALPELLGLLALLDRISAGHAVALPVEPADAVTGEIEAAPDPRIDRGAIVAAAVASVLGLAGSESLDDARALVELVRVLDRPDHASIGDTRLRWSLGELVRTGTPMIAGAAEVVQVLIGARTAAELGESIGGWLDAAVDADGRSRLADRLRGAVAVAGPLFESAPVFLEALIGRIATLDDTDYLARATALRDGFDVLSPASRQRLLRELADRLGSVDPRGGGLDVDTDVPPEVLAVAAEADRVGRLAMERI